MDTKKLRQKILDLAIRGKLVPQDPNDEPASVLLERIRAEKEQLIKEGKIKRTKKSNASDTSHYENVPFEVPENWEWVNIMEILLKLTDGTHHSPKNYPKGNYKYITAKNIKNGGIVLDNITYVDDETHHEIFSRCNPEYGDILYIKDGATTGVVAINKLTEDFSLLSSVALLKPSKLVSNKYLFYYLQSSYCYESVRSSMKGVGITRITLKQIADWDVPIPPIGEQDRIVEYIDSLFSQIDLIAKDTTILKSFLEKYKHGILNLAIAGKLVPQYPSDEPAIKLLTRINPSYKPCDNRHYENVQYPDSWKVVKMGEMVRIISGVAYSKSDVAISGIKVIRGGNIQAGEIIECDDDVYIDNRYADPTNNIYKGDIVLVASTGSQQLIGKTGFATRDYVQTQIGAFLRILRPKDIRCADFLNLFFQSDYYRQYIRSLAKGTNINNVKNSYIEDFVIGLPPLQEQNRIVAFTNKIFYMIDEILAGL